ncbi:MAG TPA: diaminopimelate epimerase [Papillibacter sp.]|jgi:diaminopimelate epimerase|nr:diaminopimelate epimerase [Papillibacter sp.]
MKFSKMHGAGNDYILIDCLENEIKDPASLCVKMSDRHFGVGGDGIILVCPSDKADFKMRMFNSLDGSEAGMCGNGIRLFGKYVYDKGLTDKTVLTVETLSGIKTLTLNVSDGKVETVRVDMGQPRLKSSDIPVSSPLEQFIAQPVESQGVTYEMTCVNMGNPHAVTFVEDVSKIDIEKVGPPLENHPLFPERANIEFIEVVDHQTLKMRVWERGSGETLACGTGACASVVAAVLNGRAKRQAKVILLGGELEIEWDEKTNHVFMTGPAVLVFEGDYPA